MKVSSLTKKLSLDKNVVENPSEVESKKEEEEKEEGEFKVAQQKVRKRLAMTSCIKVLF